MVDSLILGNGEIGSSLLRVLQRRSGMTQTAIDIKDSDFDSTLLEGCTVLHICFPFSVKFEEYVYDYAIKTHAKLVIIHSTIQVGTTTKLQNRLSVPIVHSPVQGQHPDLEESILFFDKIVGANGTRAYELAAIEMSNLHCVRVESPEASELGKILSTSYYGVCIAWHREMKRFCDEFGVDFHEAVTKFNRIYNAGYAKFKPNVIRPILTPPDGSIGGHCVTQNARLLEERIQSDFLNLIK